jgi:hypothetical protein
MSYSFRVTAANKANAVAAVQREMDAVVAAQPIHARDRDAVVATAAALCDLLPDDNSKDVTVSVAGYLAWSGSLGGGNEATVPVTGVNVSCTASLALRS